MIGRNTSAAVVILLVLLLVSQGTARMALEQSNTKDFNSTFSSVQGTCAADHRVGRMRLTVTNTGTFCDGFLGGFDCLFGGGVRGCEYPKNSGIRYCFAGAFWVGAVMGRDTLVSCGADGWTIGIGELMPADPDYDSYANLIHRSLIDPAAPEYDGAISEEDIIATYSDTAIQGVAQDGVDGRPHRPMFIKVTESSYAWSYSYAEDFILFDYKITNEGANTLKEVYMGVYVDADVGHDATNARDSRFADDVCGFVHAVPETLITRAGALCIYEDTVNIAWIADNDGDPDVPPDAAPAPHVTATRIVRTPAEKLDVSFNWWISNGDASLDFGPRERAHAGEWDEPFYTFTHGGLGTPAGDRQKYYSMRNREFDYDQVFTASVLPDDSLWLYPNQSQAIEFSDGFDTRYLLSFGPFEIDPGETLPLSFAYVAGENFHVDRENMTNNIIASYDPDEYYANLNFDDLATNARWASWIYDNPGVDTDGDGYLGQFVLCIDSMETDTGMVYDSQINYISGDGVPDFAGAKPPPAPEFWVQPSVGQLTVQFNGIRSETATDEFLARSTNNRVQHDFEGYRIYLARDERETSYSLVASFDVEDYNRYIWAVDSANPTGGWRLIDVPFTLDSLILLYDDLVDGSFNPGYYPRSNPFHYEDANMLIDSLFYFEPQDYNVSHFGIDTKIRKRFPGSAYPSSHDPDIANPDELIYRDGRPYFKYYEYEVILDDLLPTVSFWVNVTAFDFGSPRSGLPSLESSTTIGSIQAYAMSAADSIDAQSLKVFAYPNPYRIDGDYLGNGFEGRDLTSVSKAPDRKRLINFANVPPNCMIRIFTLDGDLVREMHHDVDPADPTASHASWDMITRNTQLVVSGIYYWSVENLETGEVQIGKLVIIM